MTATTDETRALVPRQAAEIEDAEIRVLAEKYLSYKAHDEKSSGLFPHDLTAIEAAEVARVGLMYGLDPLLGELTVQYGRPFVTIDGRIRQGNREPQFDGYEVDRWATEEERKAFRCVDKEDLWVIAVRRKDRQFPTYGYGRANGPGEKNYVVYHDGRGPEMARKRAIAQAVRYSFSLPLPGEWGGSEDPAVSLARGPVLEGVARSLPTHSQTAAIHAAAKEVGYSDEGYRDRLEEMFGVRSSQALNPAQADAAIAAFKAETDIRAGFAELDAGVAATKAHAASRGRRVRDDITLADDDEALHEKRILVGVPPDVPTVTTVASVPTDALAASIGSHEMQAVEQAMSEPGVPHNEPAVVVNPCEVCGAPAVASWSANEKDSIHLYCGEHIPGTSTPADASGSDPGRLEPPDDSVDLAALAAAEMGGRVEEPRPESMPAPDGGSSPLVYAEKADLERITVLVGQLGIDAADVRKDFQVEKGQRLTADQAKGILGWLEKKAAKVAK